MTDRFNKHYKHELFPDGAYVMVKDVLKGGKLDPKYEGPFKIVRRNTGGAYILQDNTGSFTFT